MIYDVIIIGGGPAACATAVYTARKKLKTLLITEAFGGQSIVSGDIQNWIGETHIPGLELAKKFEAHVRAFPDDVDVKTPETVKAIEKLNCSEDRICDFEVTTDKGAYTGKSLVLGLGARRRRLGVLGEDEFDGKGVAFCSTCDAPLFSAKDVAVVGGGNSGLEAVMDLVPYAKKIYLLHRRDTLKGDKTTQDEIAKQDKVEIIFNAETQNIFGDKFVTGLEYKDKESGEIKKLDVGGVFVEIGSIPNSEIVKDLVELDEFRQVKVDCKYATTSHPGVFAAGDITEDPFKQNNISAGDGVRAALSAYAYLQKRAKMSPAADSGSEQ
jgi:NADH-dependent peroxiredoxin subunit F